MVLDHQWVMDYLNGNDNRVAQGRAIEFSLEVRIFAIERKFVS